ncbi:YihY/virulence factor BrkB family protein [Nocardioides pantholopis]|uniref:YihY/virulence factor BrkB family protein n=1 Tax=Nocardioides pantholopis TaxID=2483798 RepID=UPI001F14A999|nr:YihY/virulence factor BrkB family protein [Nocardioides pantholopis]
MAPLGEAVGDRVVALRRRRPVVDHVVRMQQHYGDVKAGQQAGAVTYYAFLSFFPVLALSFFAVGYLSEVVPDADGTLIRAIKQVVPGLVGSGEGQVSLTDIQDAAGAVGVLGLVGVLYSGLGWVSALRDALLTVFEKPSAEQPSWVAGKLRDLLALVVLGVVLFVAVGVSGLVAGFSDDVLDLLGLGTELGILVKLLTVVLGLGMNAVLFYLMFRLLAAPHVPRSSLWSGAVLGAVAFELLKQLSGQLLSVTKDQPAFQAFGIALILVVWMNYTSRMIMYAAAWAWTSPAARALRQAEPAEPVQGPRMPSRVEAAAVNDVARPTRLASFVAGALTASGLLHLIHRRKDI